MGWLPYHIRYADTVLIVDWCNVANNRLDDPFFDQTIHRQLRFNVDAAKSTSFDALTNINEKNIALKPTGFVFHMSRCGSTLISQMLTTVQQFVVFSEPAVLETALRNTLGVSKQQQHQLLENLIQAFSMNKTDRQRTVIKFSARAVLDYSLINQLYPTVPCLFVYRDPVEVLVSLIGSQTDQLPPGLDKAGLLNEDAQVIKTMQPAEFWARVIGNQCIAALEMSACSQPLLVNYNQLPAIVWTDIAPFFNVVLSPEDIKQMQEILTRSAKQPSKLFSSDQAKKREAATKEIHALVDHFVRPYYERLESIRIDHSLQQQGKRI